MELFFKHASPTTLASLMADLNHSTEWTDAESALYKQCADELESIVGVDEAIGLLKEAGVVGL